jgi:hypothetical protein
LPSTDLKGIDRLFGRDLRSEGWFVEPVGLEPNSSENRAVRQGDEEPLDPALIWAMRWRRR